MKKLVVSLGLIVYGTQAFAQKKATHYFDNAQVADSASTLLIPIKYTHEGTSFSKVSLDEGYYANIVFYDFAKDSSRKLFDKDTYIVGFPSLNRPHYYYQGQSAEVRATSKWFFYLVKNVDSNKNGHIDNTDASILYVSDKHGRQLKALTSAVENVASLEMFEKQQFLLVKMQRDQDNDLDFENDDRDFYFQKLDLNSLGFGRKIEVK